MNINTIVQADALEFLRGIPDGSASLILVDPPYGLAGRVFDVELKGYSAVNEAWDYDVPLSWMSECQRVLKTGGSVVCFGGRQSIYTVASEGFRLGWRLVNDVTWFKPDAPPNFTGRMMTESTERALWFCPDGKNWTYNLEYAKRTNGMNYRDVWTFGLERGNRYHPTQKPIGLFERFVQLLTAPNELVIDCFMGSGTTALAARNTGRRYAGCDLDAGYVEIARRRLAEPYTPSLFPDEPAPTEPDAVQGDMFDGWE